MIRLCMCDVSRLSGPWLTICTLQFEIWTNHHRAINTCQQIIKPIQFFISWVCFIVWLDYGWLVIYCPRKIITKYILFWNLNRICQGKNIQNLKIKRPCKLQLLNLHLHYQIILLKFNCRLSIKSTYKFTFKIFNHL